MGRISAETIEKMNNIDPEFQELIPPLSATERSLLEENICRDGCRDALVVWDGILLDGHNRLEICKAHDIPFKTVDAPEEIKNRTDARVWIRNNQRARRNLTPAWMIELELGNKEDLLKKGEQKREQTLKQNVPVLSQCDRTVESHSTRNEIAKSAGVSSGQVAMAEQVRKKAPELWGQAKTGEVSISTAYKTVRREEKKEKRRVEITATKEKIHQKTQEITDKFDVIVIDPPWPYGREYNPETSRVASPYPEMSIDNISKIKLPLKSDAVVFLWTTHAFLKQAFYLLECWELQHKAIIVWDKEKMGMGANIRMQCEFCLLAFKGKPIIQGAKERDIIREKRREHSRKPNAFYEMVERMTVGGKLDFFSRERREGWISWGAEDEKF